jgi:prephenate dehydrogenase
MPLLGQDLPRALSGRAAILGPGLIGGSLAMALHRKDWSVSVLVRRPEALEKTARLLTGCQVSTDPAAVLGECDVAVLCSPPSAIKEAGPMLSSLLPSTAAVTDAGSVKRSICDSLAAPLGPRFIGAHPMAGSEKSGIDAARHDLFADAPCILTPPTDADPHALALVRKLWTDAGCRLFETSPADHDRAIARISHLPHAAAAAIVSAALDSDPTALRFASTGFRDTTRVASAPPSLWTGILLDNHEEVSHAIADLQTRLGELKIALDRGDRHAIKAFLTHAATLRATMNANH